MGIVGNLKTMQLAELLQWLSQSQKSGTLQIQLGGVEKKIFFREGRVISSSSTRPEEYLGHFLVSHGFISDGNLTIAIQQQKKSGMLLGKILVEGGAISEADLHRLLRLKAEESIYDVFSWSEGDFKFLDDVLPEHPMVEMNLDVTAIILEGVQRVDEWRRIRGLIPNADVIPVAVAELDGRHLDPDRRRILDYVDDERTVGEIQRETHLTEFQVCRVLFEQYNANRLKLVRPRGIASTNVEATAAPVVSAAAASAAANNGGPVDAMALLNAAKTYLAASDWEPALRHLRAARALDPDRKEIQEALTAGEKKIRDEVERSGVTLASIPKLARKMEELTAIKISPQEGFMLTRINGSYDIQSIVKITPMPQLDALLVFWKLQTGGHITFAPPKGK